MAPRGRRRRGGASAVFVDGGWLTDWKPFHGKKKRHSKAADTTVIPSPAQAQSQQHKKVVLPGQPGRAAVFEDKQPMTMPMRSLSTSEEEDEDDSEDDDHDGFSSSVDSELAEDYADNLAEGFSIDELTYVSANEQEYHDLFPSTDDDDEEESDEGKGDKDLYWKLMDDDESEESSDDGKVVESGVWRQALVLKRNGGSEVTEAVEPSFVLYAGRDMKKKKQKRRPENGQRAAPGEKKHARKEKIAAKRRERASRRGVDLEKLNLMLEGMVITNSDVLSLQPMKNKDLSLVSKLAAVYRLKLACQGSGKKRFATVIRTRHTCLPQGEDSEHLLKLLGSRPAQAKGGEAGRMAAKYKRAARQARQGLKRELMGERLGAQSSGVKPEGGRRRRMRKEAVSFVSSGVIEAEQGGGGGVSVEVVKVVREEEIGKFEAHTKGFGSRMLAKMGFVEGGGLGRDGQGMKQALLPQMRPRSLGLGARGN